MPTPESAGVYIYLNQVNTVTHSEAMQAPPPTHTHHAQVIVDYRPLFPHLKHDFGQTADECQRLVDLRDMAYGNPLHPGSALQVTIRARTGPPPLEIRRENTRTLPDFARDGGSYKLILRKALHPFDPVENIHDIFAGQWAQVWRADVHPAGLPVRDTLKGSVVLKIFQPSLMPIPNPESPNVRDYVSASQRAAYEAYFYERLVERQGFAVPYYYDGAIAKMPNGEDAHVLLFEDVKVSKYGANFAEFCATFANTPEKKESIMRDYFPVMMRSVGIAVDDIHLAGVLHAAISLENLLVTNEAMVVFVDFGQSRVNFPTKFLNYERTEALGKFVRAFVPHYTEGFREWIVEPGNLLDDDEKQVISRCLNSEK